MNAIVPLSASFALFTTLLSSPAVARRLRPSIATIPPAALLIAALVVAALQRGEITQIADRATVAAAILAASSVGGLGVVGGLIRGIFGARAQDNSDLPASAWVGVVERFGFVAALLLGLPEVAAVVLAIKALGQYGATKDAGNRLPAIRVFGTLASFSWALVCYAILGVCGIGL